MAERLTILCLGDLTAVGTRPLSELTAINAAYDDVQTDMDIWNIQSQAWQALQPGVNTNTYVTANDKWSFESRLREALRSKIPTGKLYVLKYAVDSSLLNNNTAKPVWNPAVVSGLLAGLTTQITSAAAAANAAGDTLKIVGVLSSIMTEDFGQPSYSREFHPVYQHLIEEVRSRVAGAIAHCSSGSLRGDGSFLPWVAIEPHYNWGTTAGFTISEALLHGQRMRTQMLDSEQLRIRVQRTHGYATDNKGFAAASIIALTDELASKFYAPAAPSESANPPGDLVGIFGDSIAEGTGTISELPTHLQAAISGVKIWFPFLATPFTPGGTLQTLQAGINNMTSILIPPTAHGLEIPLASLMRERLGDHYMVKGAVPGTLATAQKSPALTDTIPPLIDRLVNNWHPALQGQLAELMVRGWAATAISAIRKQGKRPRARLVVISLGSNDILLAKATPDQCLDAVKATIREIDRVFAENYVDVTLLKYCAVVPASSMGGLFSSTVETVEGLRSALNSLPQIDARVFTVDVNKVEVGDGIHPSTAGYLDLSKAIAVGFDQLSPPQYLIEPLFMPSSLALRKALRLSQVPDSNDGTSVIDTAIEAAKVGFFRNLGEAKIAELRAIPYTTDPKTVADYLRVLAANTEVKWVRAQLLRSMPVLFMDGTSKVQTWNEEAAFREGGFLQTRDELKRLQDEINSALDTLRTSNLAEGGASFSTVQPDDTIAPGDTVLSVF